MRFVVGAGGICQGSILLTNAKKVTVSVLYWYGKLTSLQDYNFWTDPEKGLILLPLFFDFPRGRPRGPRPSFPFRAGFGVFGNRSQTVFRHNFVCDHTQLKTPYPVRFAKLSSYRLS